MNTGVSMSPRGVCRMPARECPSVAISSNGERGFVLGDVVISELDAVEPDLQTVFDWDRTLAVRTRKATIARLAGEQALVGASHLPAPGLGRFVAAGGAHRWQAI